MTLSQESHEHIVRASQLACLSARDRLEQLLSQFISALRLRGQQREVRLRLPLKQLEIAGVIAVTPEHLCVILKRMQEEGMIRREKGWIIVTDPERLSSPADL
jgi:CRP-like cAMP-binding protein